MKPLKCAPLSGWAPGVTYKYQTSLKNNATIINLFCTTASDEEKKVFYIDYLYNKTFNGCNCCHIVTS
jgi:hypothetical protein